jgi:hypothetical protein
MELTTKLPAPRKQKFAAIIIKLIVIVGLLYLKNDHQIISLFSSTSLTTTNKYLNGLAAVATDFFHESFPKLVASGITMYLGVCCGYVGLIHLNVLKNN